MAAAKPEKNAFIDGVTSAMFDVETGGRSERFPLLGDPSARGQPQHQRQQQQRRQGEQNPPETFTEPDAVQVLEKLPLLLVRAVAVFTMATTSACVLAAVSAPGDPRVEHLCTCDSAPRKHGGPLPLARLVSHIPGIYLVLIDKPVLHSFLPGISIVIVIVHTTTAVAALLLFLPLSILRGLTPDSNHPPGARCVPLLLLLWTCSAHGVGDGDAPPNTEWSSFRSRSIE